MLLDDLDFFLLDIASEFPISLDIFSRIDLDCRVNRKVPAHNFEELKLALAEMFQRGDAVACIEWPGRRNRRTFLPTRDEIEAGLRSAFELSYRLTTEGGKRWESVVEADWSLYLSASGSLRYGWREAQSQEYLEYILEIERAEGSIRGKIRWKELRPWRPLYWKTLPHGYQARCGLAIKDPREPFQYTGVASPPWGQELTPRFHRGPKGLAPRKLRHPQAPIAEDTNSGPSEKKTELPQRGNERTLFSAACDYAQGADADALRKMLARPFGEVRFASVRQLAERRESAAVPQLTALVLRKHYLPALWALGEIADERTLPVLELLLEYGGANHMHPDSSWGGVLVRAIARFGDRAIPMLEKMLTSQNISAVRGAVETLGLIQSKLSVAMLERERDLEVSTKKRRIIWHIEQALRRRPGKDFTGQRRLRTVANLTSDMEDGSIPSGPIKALVATLNHPESIRRRPAVDLLVEFGARDHLGEIEKLATDSEWRVRASVAYAFRRLAGSRDLLAALAGDQNLVVRWLAKNDIIPPR